MSYAWLGLALRVVIGGLLIWAGWEKLHAIEWWEATFRELRVIFDRAARPVAVVSPGVELVVGIALVAGFWTRPAAWLAAIMFTIFAVVLFSVIWREIDAECGCFGPDSSYPVSMTAVLRNLALAGLAILLAFLPTTALSVDGFFTRD